MGGALGDYSLGRVTDRLRQSRHVWMLAVVRRRGTVTHRAGEKGPSETAQWQWPGIGGGTSHGVKGLVWPSTRNRDKCGIILKSQ